jgi:hypothetical protein
MTWAEIVALYKLTLDRPPQISDASGAKSKREMHRATAGLDN